VEMSVRQRQQSNNEKEEEEITGADKNEDDFVTRKKKRPSSWGLVDYVSHFLRVTSAILWMLVFTVVIYIITHWLSFLLFLSSAFFSSSLPSSSLPPPSLPPPSSLPPLSISFSLFFFSYLKFYDCTVHIVSPFRLLNFIVRYK
jgi:hypothetical protein